MDKKTAQVVVQTLVLLQIDYCNALMMGSTEYQINKLQRIQNMACRVICSVRKYDSITDHYKGFTMALSSRVDSIQNLHSYVQML